MTSIKDPDTNFSQPARLPEQVAEFLASEIRSGKLKPGDRLPAEMALGKQFGVSRTVVREALARLKYDGLVESRQGKGMRVSNPSQRQSFRLDNINPQNVMDINYLYEMRVILEGEAAAMAALRADEAGLAKLEQHWNEMDRAVREKSRGSQAHIAFHLCVAEIGHNHYLLDFTIFLQEKLRSLMQQVRANTAQSPRRALTVLKEHRVMLDAIHSGDPNQARKATLTHLHNAAKRNGLWLARLRDI